MSKHEQRLRRLIARAKNQDHGQSKGDVFDRVCMAIARIVWKEALRHERASSRLTDPTKYQRKSRGPIKKQTATKAVKEILAQNPWITGVELARRVKEHQPHSWSETTVWSLASRLCKVGELISIANPNKQGQSGRSRVYALPDTPKPKGLGGET